MKITKNMLGCIKGLRDPRDYLVKSFFTMVAVPASLDLTDKMTPVRSQGNEGSCVGFAAVTGVKEFQEQKEHDKFIELSPRYVYEGAKILSSHSEGTTLIAAMKILKSCGVCQERFWPYIARDKGSLKKGGHENAAKYRIKSYARITSIDELKESLCDPNIGAVMIGVKVYDGMMSEDCRKTGIVSDPTCWERMNVRGGHALTICSYDDNSPYFNDGHFKVKNSWGAYGDKGYLYLSYKYMKANLMDSYAAIDVVDENVKIQRLGGNPEWKRV